MLKLLANVHLFPHSNPDYSHRAGAEVFLYQLLQAWNRKGYSSTVTVRVPVPDCKYDGTFVRGRKHRLQAIQDADLVITHLDETRWTMQQCKKYHKPLIHLIHNHYSIDFFNTDEYAQQYLFAAHWLEEKTRGTRDLSVPAVVCHPPVPRYSFRTTTPLDQRRYIGFVNPNRNKGGDILYYVAATNPDLDFLVVAGAYGEAETRIESLPNIHIIDQTPNMKNEFYAHIRVLFMPSAYESFGMVATEALMSSIPVVCTATPGLIENLGNAGYMVESTRRKNIGYWSAILRDLMFNDEIWQHWSERSLIRGIELYDKFSVRSVISSWEIMAELHRRKNGTHNGKTA